MTSRSRFMLAAASLAVIPLGTALAQNNNPAGNMGSNQSVTATPTTADHTASHGMNTAAGKTRHRASTKNAMNRTTPGATGTSVVPGTSSTIAGDRPATTDTKTGVIGGTAN